MKSNFRAAMNAKNLPWKNLTEKLVKENVVESIDYFQFNLLHYVSNMAEFSIDPKGKLAKV